MTNNNPAQRRVPRTTLDGDRQRYLDRPRIIRLKPAAPLAAAVQGALKDCAEAARPAPILVGYDRIPLQHMRPVRDRHGRLVMDAHGRPKLEPQ